MSSQLDATKSVLGSIIYSFKCVLDNMETQMKNLTPMIEKSKKLSEQLLEVSKAKANELLDGDKITNPLTRLELIGILQMADNPDSCPQDWSWNKLLEMTPVVSDSLS